ncbi:amino acid permease [Flexivirga alba]|uniref:Amino acid permease n=1 Tax=Flexivirga alba TaxID=702742 RepID=A0ABW2ALY7_9MICO
MKGSLSVPQGASLSIGAVLGTGVITLPALGVQVAGPASLIAWIALVLLSIPLATTFAAMGARRPDGRGVSAYVDDAFGSRAAGAIGWCFYFAVPVGAPPASLMAGAYVSDAIGGGRMTAVATATCLIVGVGLLNAAGLRLSGRVQLVLTAVLAALISVAVLVAAPHGTTAHLDPFAPHGIGAIGAAAALLVWGFAGWEAIAPLAGEYRNPRRDLPRATAIALAVVSVLYLALAAATVLVLGPAAADTSAPLSALLVVGVGGPARIVTAVIAVMLTVGTMNAYFAGGSRLGAALAADGALPAGLAKGSAAGAVPRRSLAVVTGLALGSLLANEIFHFDLTQLMLLTTGCFTTVYVIGTAAAVRLLPRRSVAWWTAVIAFLSVSVLLVMNGPHVLWALGAAGASLVYRAIRRERPVTPAVATTDQPCVEEASPAG